MESAIIRGMNAAHGAGMPTTLFGFGGILTTITGILLYVVGALAVIMVVVGGLRYAISGGNSVAVTAARNTVVYAIVGLVIAVLAYAIVNFVLGAIFPSNIGGLTNV
jgi:hypothetical protein